MNGKLHAKTVDASSVADGFDGEAWVTFRTRIKGKYRQQLAKYQGIIKRLQSAESGSEDEVEAHKEMILFDEKIIPKVVVALIIKWNWIDEETGNQHGKPTAEIIRDEITFDQQVFLLSNIYNIVNGATGENPTNGDN